MTPLEDSARRETLEAQRLKRHGVPESTEIKSSSADNATYRRNAYVRDVDRLVHSQYLARLSGVTQVTHALDLSHAHTRYSHSIKVSKIARRIAQMLLDRHEQDGPIYDGTYLRDHLDPDVVEAAGLAHDLGHPPFGHIGEKTLDILAIEAGMDGFEGNAQSFRILGRLARHHDAPSGGLGLTRATMRAILKYPYMRDTNEQPKFGAYEIDADILDWTLEYGPKSTDSKGRRHQSIEAAVMDWADDITYAIHDLEDYYRAGLIRSEGWLTEYLLRTSVGRETDKPSDVLADLTEGLNRKQADAIDRLWEESINVSSALDRLQVNQTSAEEMETSTLQALTGSAGFPGDRYTNRDDLNQAMTLWRSTTVKRLMDSVKVDNVDGFPLLGFGDGPGESSSRATSDEAVLVRDLKSLTKSAVHQSSALQSIQIGNRAVISSIFLGLVGPMRDGKTFKSKALSEARFTIPVWASDQLNAFENAKVREPVKAQLWCRVVFDSVASLTDAGAQDLASRLRGSSLNTSVLDSIWR